MGAAYSCFGRTKVLYATSLALLDAKAKFLQRKQSVSISLEDWKRFLKCVDLNPYYQGWSFSKIIWLCKSFIKIRNRIRPMTDPWGTSDNTGTGSWPWHLKSTC